MNNPGLFQSRWNLGRLVLCNVVPLALLAFWLWPTGQMLCVIFDEWLFRSGGATAIAADLKKLDDWPTPEEAPEFYIDYGEQGPYVAEVGEGECAAS